MVYTRDKKYHGGCSAWICMDYTRAEREWGQQLIHQYTFCFRSNSGLLGEGRYIFCLWEVAIASYIHRTSIELLLTPPHTLHSPHLSLARCVSTLPWSVRRLPPPLLSHNPSSFSSPQTPALGWGLWGFRGRKGVAWRVSERERETRVYPVLHYC